MKEPDYTRFWLVKQFFSVVCSLSRISELVIIDGFLGSVLQIITRTGRIPYQNNNLFQILVGTLIFSNNSIKSKWNTVDVSRLVVFKNERIVKVVRVLNKPHFFCFSTILKPFGFLCFQGIEKRCIGNEWVKFEIFFFFLYEYRTYKHI